MEQRKAITRGAAALAEGVRTLYQEGQTDYSLGPLVVVDRQSTPLGRIKEGDAVIFCCRRGEREIQLTEAFVDPDFDHFPRPSLKDLIFVPFTLYHEKFLNLPVAFPPFTLKDTLGEVVSRHGLRQLRVAESEKFAHVTFFFNGGKHHPFPGEDDVEVPSPRSAPLGHVPELNASGITAAVLQGMAKEYHIVVANFANGDVIGHLPEREAKIKCAEAVDRSLGSLLQAAMAAQYVMIVTADHGILEMTVKADATPNVGHTANPVPFILVNEDPGSASGVGLRDGTLADVAPTVLEVLGLPKPEAMTGRSLLQSSLSKKQRRVLLVILDGWGLGVDDETNPIFSADTPVWDRVKRDYPSSALEASGEAVGLSRGKMGNSEAGHINLGAGRVVVQDDARLDQAMGDGSFFANEIFLGTMGEVKRRRSCLHLLTLLSEKSSHGSVEYTLALLRMARAQGLHEVSVHIIFDGRSTEPGSASHLLHRLGEEMAAIGIGQVVSGVGRGFALDRTRDYGKTRIAYDAFVLGRGKTCRVK